MGFSRTCDIHERWNSGRITLKLINCYRKSWTFWVVACYFSHQAPDTKGEQVFIIALPGFPKLSNMLLYYIAPKCACLPVQVCLKSKAADFFLSAVWFVHIKTASTSYITPFTLVFVFIHAFIFELKLTHSAHTVLVTDASCSEGGKMTELRESEKLQRTREVRLNL